MWGVWGKFLQSLGLPWNTENIFTWRRRSLWDCIKVTVNLLKINTRQGDRKKVMKVRHWICGILRFRWDLVSMCNDRKSFQVLYRSIMREQGAGENWIRHWWSETTWLSSLNHVYKWGIKIFNKKLIGWTDIRCCIIGRGETACAQKKCVGSLVCETGHFSKAKPTCRNMIEMYFVQLFHSTWF